MNLTLGNSLFLFLFLFLSDPTHSLRFRFVPLLTRLVGASFFTSLVPVVTALSVMTCTLMH